MIGQNALIRNSGVRYVRRQVVVDDKRYLLNVNATRPHIRRDQNTAGKEVSKLEQTSQSVTYEVPLRNSAMIASRSF